MFARVIVCYFGKEKILIFSPVGFVAENVTIIRVTSKTNTKTENVLHAGYRLSKAHIPTRGDCFQYLVA